MNQFYKMNSFLVSLLCVFLWSNVPVAKSQTGDISSARPRIVGGQLAHAGQFPWAAAIYKTTADGNYFCGGSLLSSDWVLTAGQCVDGALLFTIILGTTKLQGDENAVRVSTETYVLHPDYNQQTLENDVGLIRFRQSITLSTYIRSISLPYLETGEGDWVAAIGWGQTSDAESGLSNDLNRVTMAALSNDECKIYYGDQIKENMVCAAGEYNEGACYGDIGGALMWLYRITYYHGGIASFVSSNGCESINPSGYTRTYPYNDWIRNVTGVR